MDIYLFDVRDHPLYNVTTGKNVGHTEPKKFRKRFYQWLAQKPTIRMGGDTWDQQMGPNMTNLGQKDM